MNKQTKKFRKELKLLQNYEMDYFKKILIRKYQVTENIGLIGKTKIFMKKIVHQNGSNRQQKNWDRLNNEYSPIHTKNDLDYYHDNPIQYRWNNYGFRTDNDLLIKKLVW